MFEVRHELAEDSGEVSSRQFFDKEHIPMVLILKSPFVPLQENAWHDVDSG